MNWNQTEPLRLYVYSVLAPLAAVLVFYGVLDGNAVPLILAAGAALLGVPAVELSRSKVASPETQVLTRNDAVTVLAEAGYLVVAPLSETDQDEDES